MRDFYFNTKQMNLKGIFFIQLEMLEPSIKRNFNAFVIIRELEQFYLFYNDEIGIYFMDGDD